jgi:hypothetical protein
MAAGAILTALCFSGRIRKSFTRSVVTDDGDFDKIGLIKVL